MAWTVPVNTDWETDDIPTQTMILLQLLDDIRHLRGLDGITELEGDVNPLTDNARDLGSGTKLWRNAFAMRFFMGVKVRRIVWDDLTAAQLKLTVTQSGAGSAHEQTGFGQHSLKVDDDQAGNIEFNPTVETDPAGWQTGQTPNTALQGSKNPSLMGGFYVNAWRASGRVFVGLRATRASASIPGVAENQVGLHWDGTNNFVRTSNGTTNTDSATFALASGWHLIHLVLKSATRAEVFIDRVSRANITTTLPTGNLELSLTLISVSGGGAGNDMVLTSGEIEVADEP